MNYSFINKKTGLVVGGAFLVLVLISWVAGHGYLQINLPDASRPAYSLTNQKGASSGGNIDKKSLNKLVSSGTYKAVLTNGEKSYVAVVQVPGFLRTGRTTASLQPEKARKFIGDNPASCAVYNGKLLASYDCGGTAKDINLHIPANAYTPSYVVKNTQESHPGLIEGTVQLEQGDFVLLHTDTSHILYRLTDTYQLVEGRVMDSLDSTKEYQIKNFGSGFIVFTGDFSSVVAYANPGALPIRLSVPKPANRALLPVALTVYGDSVGFRFSNSTGSESSAGNTGDSAIVVYQNQRYSTFNLKGTFASSYGCGPNLLCVLRSRTFEVYNASGAKPKLLYSVDGINSVESGNGKLYLIDSRGIIDFNQVKRTGYYLYTFGKYGYCGQQSTRGGILVCLTGQNQKRQELFVNEATADTQETDKKILELQKNQLIGSLSIYDNFIFVTPALQPNLYNASTNSFGYDPAQLQYVSRELKQAVIKSGIDTTVYKVLNTATFEQL